MKLINEFLYFSVGFASRTGDKLTQMMQKLVEQNKVTKSEAKTFIDDFNLKMKDLTLKFDEKLENFITEDINSLSFITSTELKKIEKRVAKIEKLLDAKLAAKTQK